MEKTTATDPDGIIWTHDIALDQDGDGFWYDEHFAVSPTGDRHHLPWSRFGHFGPRHFIRYVEAGMPEAQDDRKLAPEGHRGTERGLRPPFLHPHPPITGPVHHASLFHGSCQLMTIRNR